MLGCHDPGPGQAAAISIRTRVLDGGVVGGGARPPDDRRPGAGGAGAGAGDAGFAVAVQPDQVPPAGWHPAAPALPGDELHVAAKPHGSTSGWPRAQRRLAGHPLGVHQPRQRAAQHAQAGGWQTVRTMNHFSFPRGLKAAKIESQRQ